MTHSRVRHGSFMSETCRIYAWWVCSVRVRVRVHVRVHVCVCVQLCACVCVCVCVFRCV